MWIALQQSCEDEFLSNWDAAKVGLDVQEVPVAEPGDGGWAGEEGVSTGGIEITTWSEFGE